MNEAAASSWQRSNEFASLYPCDMRILAVCGSLQAKSENLALLNAAGAAVPLGVELVLFDGLRDLPHFNPDIEASGVPWSRLPVRVDTAGRGGGNTTDDDSERPPSGGQLATSGRKACVHVYPHLLPRGKRRRYPLVRADFVVDGPRQFRVIDLESGAPSRDYRVCR